jgi:UDP-3-O-[3-hydroxymyristoyl] N-acetylglucosamine deacetylase
MNYQRTVKEAVTIEGIGVHSGKTAKIRINPEKAHSGITFMRADNGRHKISLSPDHVVSTMNNSAIGFNGSRIMTVEHLLSSLYGLGIDNAMIEVWGEEIPIMDGSAKVFVEEILKVGIEKLDQPKKFILVKKPVRVEETNKYAAIDPSPDFRVEFVISFDHPLLKYQRREFKFDGEDLEKEISPARTFGFINEVEVLRNNGLAKGGSLDNVVVISDEGVLNPEGMRFRDEPVRHKILDSLGDLMILGTYIIGEYRGFKAGHKLNHQLLMALMSNPDNYQIIEAGHPRLAKENGFKIPRWLTPLENDQK